MSTSPVKHTHLICVPNVFRLKLGFQLWPADTDPIFSCFCIRGCLFSMGLLEGNVVGSFLKPPNPRLKSKLPSSLLGHEDRSIHENLLLPFFHTPLVKFFLQFRFLPIKQSFLFEQGVMYADENLHRNLFSFLLRVASIDDAIPCFLMASFRGFCCTFLHNSYVAVFYWTKFWNFIDKYSGKSSKQEQNWTKNLVIPVI